MILLVPKMRNNVNDLVGLEGYCRRHGKRCCLPKVKRIWTTPSCVGQSSQGAGLRSDDPSVVYLVAWAAITRVLKVPCFGFENPKGARYLLDSLMADMYHIESAPMDPPEFGWCASRPRELHIASLHGCIEAPSETFETFVSRFHRPLTCSWQALFWKDSFDDDDETAGVIPREKQSELEWAKARPTCGAHAAYHDGTIDSDGPFFESLNKMEHVFLKNYRGESPGIHCYSLAQNPLEHPQMSWGHILQAVIRNCHLMWADRKSLTAWDAHCAARGCGPAPPRESRWMMPTELLTSQGFRLHPDFMRVQFPSLAFPVVFETPFMHTNPKRNSAALKHQSGNTVNTNVMGIAWLRLLLCRTIVKSDAEQCATDKFGHDDLLAELMNAMK